MRAWVSVKRDELLKAVKSLAKGGEMNEREEHQETQTWQVTEERKVELKERV